MNKLILFALLSLIITGCSSAPSVSKGVIEKGKASYYADKYHGRTTASGEVFNQQALSAAHQTLGFGSRVKVTNISNNKSVIVTINDRGPFIRGRIIDLSKKAFSQIASVKQGVIDVTVERLD
ncbi:MULTISPECIES: septal ring lytic transglycosylase RlpA family protein [unclassified Pseudoalteromonas]|uniref:septal ring lytic transglycosylase RlpA family protein n=1 Tax=Pseudoalteromonas TaxID=53246 RepID=UPI0014313569|nr:MULTISPECIES: septal ring lytic transglycosylase RlpA family protein [unclassified Pseudoalteromonas]MCG9707476.1 septal ring lytic transglycosylase RlpA family protein [Pseudoalteromonas sp. Isolate3]NIZ05989.1 septal ring lytic transglycosylase RlpA family protein [Pseudoalteromonas sp. HF66]QLE09899.1 septal ring lytic transglycosylase RlpA family protein [Pseudoalteromonas shioyasakiensis]